MPDETIASRYAAMRGQCENIMQRVRECSALTLPWLVPPLEHQPDQKLPEPFNSLGAEACGSLGGRLLSSILPSQLPWFKLEMDARLRLDPDVPGDVKNGIAQNLFRQEVLLQGLLESSNLFTTKNRYSRGFRTQMRSVLDQVIVTGDSLFMLTDDYRIVVFRRDQYVTKRDNCGDVLCHVIKESKYGPALTDEQLSKAKLSRESLNKEAYERRMVDLYTLVEWDSRDDKWTWTQEVNGQEVNSGEDKIGRYFSVPLDLAPGDDYGRGMVERHLGEVRTTNELEQRLLEFAGLASMGLVAKDYDSLTEDEDFQKEPGSTIRCRVSGGEVQDAAIFKANNYADMKQVDALAERKEQRLSRRFLMQSGAVRDSERTTAFEIARITIAELDSAVGGLYAPLSDAMQAPLLARLYAQAERDKLIPRLSEAQRKIVSTKFLTGAAALAAQAKAQRLVEFTQFVRELTPSQQERINEAVLFDALARYQGVDEPGLVRTDAELQAMRQQQAQVEAQQAAQIQGSQLAANVVESALTTQTAA